MQKDRFNEQEASRLLMRVPGMIGYCQYEGEKPEHGYLMIAISGGVMQALGRYALRCWQGGKGVCE